MVQYSIKSSLQNDLLAEANHTADNSCVVVVPAIVTDGAPLSVGEDLHEAAGGHVLTVEANEDVVTIKVHRGGSGDTCRQNGGTRVKNYRLLAARAKFCVQQ